eukprot:TRINITY_DN98286_c0_g1_i1.p1 TRINITY_DN98286_c0_g1~~TRINITY_DN98286_c0_g1_i1.p1  ORF type:complete len:310 (-),score=58.88 TRINITY_DN98286_c0_g1_i1:133-1062(-)
MAQRAIALVTGGTRGIGKGISQALASKGYDLLLGYGTNEKAAKEHAESLMQEYGVKVAISGGDVSEESTISNYFERLKSEFGGQKLHVVVHNAGQYLGVTADNSAGIAGGEKRILGNGSMLKEDGSVDLSYMRYYHRIYGEAWVQLLERAIPILPDGEGAVVGISSPGCNSSYQPAQGYDMPGSGKCVMETTARYYAKNLASRRITVNVVIPGYTESDAWNALAKSMGKGEQNDNSFIQSAAAMRAPVGYAQTARNLGETVAFLCGQHGRYITGVALPVDGGLHLGQPAEAGGKGSSNEGKGKGTGYKD